MTNKQKFYIKQFVITKDSFQEWADNHYNKLKGDNAIIGYLFSKQEKCAFNLPIYVMNLYLIKRSCYKGTETNLDGLNLAWELFFNKCKTKNDKHITVFSNPPIEQWLDTKDNWCKKMATEISRTFNWTYDDALSETYEAILKCYGKGTVYMGNLNYLKKSIYNSVLMVLRKNYIRLNGDSGKVVSLDSVFGSDPDGNDILLSDVIVAEEDVSEERFAYQNFLGCVKDLLKDTFSEREIDQIISYKPACLPTNLYKRLLAWRQRHSQEEVL